MRYLYQQCGFFIFLLLLTILYTSLAGAAPPIQNFTGNQGRGYGNTAIGNQGNGPNAQTAGKAGTPGQPATTITPSTGATPPVTPTLPNFPSTTPGKDKANPATDQISKLIESNILQLPDKNPNDGVKEPVDKALDESVNTEGLHKITDVSKKDDDEIILKSNKNIDKEDKKDKKAKKDKNKEKKPKKGKSIKTHGNNKDKNKNKDKDEADVPAVIPPTIEDNGPTPSAEPPNTPPASVENPPQTPVANPPPFNDTTTPGTPLPPQDVVDLPPVVETIIEEVAPSDTPNTPSFPTTVNNVETTPVVNQENIVNTTDMINQQGQAIIANTDIAIVTDNQILIIPMMNNGKLDSKIFAIGEVKVPKPTGCYLVLHIQRIKPNWQYHHPIACYLHYPIDKKFLSNR